MTKDLFENAMEGERGNAASVIPDDPVRLAKLIESNERLTVDLGSVTESGALESYREPAAPQRFTLVVGHKKSMGSRFEPLIFGLPPGGLLFLFHGIASDPLVEQPIRVVFWCIFVIAAVAWVYGLALAITSRRVCIVGEGGITTVTVIPYC